MTDDNKPEIILTILVINMMTKSHHNPSQRENCRCYPAIVNPH